MRKCGQHPCVCGGGRSFTEEWLTLRETSKGESREILANKEEIQEFNKTFKVKNNRGNYKGDHHG